MRIALVVAVMIAVAGCASNPAAKEPMKPRVEWDLKSDQNWDKITIILEKDGRKTKLDNDAENATQD